MPNFYLIGKPWLDDCVSNVHFLCKYIKYNSITFPEVYSPLNNCFDFVKNSHFYTMSHTAKAALQ